MYPEILRGLASSWASSPVQDTTTLSDMAYLSSQHAWVSFTGATAAASMIKTMQKYRLGGAGIYTLDMDTADEDA